MRGLGCATWQEGGRGPGGVGKGGREVVGCCGRGSLRLGMKGQGVGVVLMALCCCCC